MCENFFLMTQCGSTVLHMCCLSLQDWTKNCNMIITLLQPMVQYKSFHMKIRILQNPLEVKFSCITFAGGYSISCSCNTKIRSCYVVVVIQIFAYLLSWKLVAEAFNTFPNKWLLTNVPIVSYNTILKLRVWDLILTVGWEILTIYIFFIFQIFSSHFSHATTPQFLSHTIFHFKSLSKALITLSFQRVSLFFLCKVSISIQNLSFHFYSNSSLSFLRTTRV